MREILIVGKKGTNYILYSSQTGKTLSSTKGVLAFFSFTFAENLEIWRNFLPRNWEDLSKCIAVMDFPWIVFTVVLDKRFVQSLYIASFRYHTFISAIFQNLFQYKIANKNHVKTGSARVLCRFLCLDKNAVVVHVVLVRVVWKVDNATDRINYYPSDTVVCFVNT